MEAGLAAEILDDDRLVGRQCVARMRIPEGIDQAAHLPSDRRANAQLFLVRLQLTDSAELDAQCVRDERNRLFQQRPQLGGAQRMLAELGDRPLLLQARA